MLLYSQMLKKCQFLGNISKITVQHIFDVHQLYENIHDVISILPEVTRFRNTLINVGVNSLAYIVIKKKHDNKSNDYR